MMKQFKFTLFLTVAVSLLFTQSCTDDTGSTGTPDNPTKLGPELSFVAETGFVSANSEVKTGEVFKIKIKTVAGDADLKSLTIKEDATNLPTDRFTINNGGIIANNPLLIVDKKGTTYEIAITSVNAFKTAKTYSFEVADDGGLKDKIEVTVTTTGEGVTLLTGIIMNQAGPTGQGGLDLETGNSTGTIVTAKDSTAKKAHIKDEGIDLSKPNDKNWKQQISGINGSVIRKAGTKLGENFSFDKVAFKEEVVAAYGNGDELTLSNAKAEKTTDVLKVGDVFMVKNGEKYWMIKVTKITPTASNNEDSVEFSIKK